MALPISKNFHVMLATFTFKRKLQHVGHKLNVDHMWVTFQLFCGSVGQVGQVGQQV